MILKLAKLGSPYVGYQIRQGRSLVLDLAVARRSSAENQEVVKNFFLAAVLLEVLRTGCLRSSTLFYLQKWRLPCWKAAFPSALQLDQDRFLVRCSYRSKCMGSAIEVQVTQRKCRDGITSRSSELCKATLCRANKHIDVVLLEHLVDSAVPANRPGMLKENTVSVRIIFKRRCVFKDILTGILFQRELAFIPCCLQLKDSRGGSSVSALSLLNWIKSSSE